VLILGLLGFPLGLLLALLLNIAWIEPSCRFVVRHALYLRVVAWHVALSVIIVAPAVHVAFEVNSAVVVDAGREHRGTSQHRFRHQAFVILRLSPAQHVRQLLFRRDSARVVATRTYLLEPQSGFSQGNFGYTKGVGLINRLRVIRRCMFRRLQTLIFLIWVELRM